MTRQSAIEELKCYRAKSGTEYPEEIDMAIAALEKETSEQKKIWILIDYIINKIHSCPIDDESGVDFKKECVGFGKVGCGECILRHLDDLDC